MGQVGSCWAMLAHLEGSWGEPCTILGQLVPTGDSGDAKVARIVKGGIPGSSPLKAG